MSIYEAINHLIAAGCLTGCGNSTGTDAKVVENKDSADVFISYNDSLLRKRIDVGNCEPLSELLKKNNVDAVEYFGEGVKNYEIDGEYHMIPTVTDIIIRDGMQVSRPQNFQQRH